MRSILISLPLVLTYIKMTLQSSSNRTEFAFRNIQYRKTAPAGLFNPNPLQDLARQPFWNEFGAAEKLGDSI
jgi:hypothetical protein